MLDNDFDLTDDDREVFLKIRRGELWVTVLKDV
jgi:hypothetical protein